MRAWPIISARTRIQPKAFSRAFAPRSAGSLRGSRTGDGQDSQGVHVVPRVEGAHLDVPTVDDVHDAADGERRFGDVRRHDALALMAPWSFEHAQLLIVRERAVHRQDD